MLFAGLLTELVTALNFGEKGMMAWGVVLMIIGALSFVLPMMGRQFIVVSLLGFTGMGSAVAGIVLIGIGGFLFHLAREEEKKQDEAHRQHLRDILSGKVKN